MANMDLDKLFDFEESGTVVPGGSSVGNNTSAMGIDHDIDNALRTFGALFERALNEKRSDSSVNSEDKYDVLQPNSVSVRASVLSPTQLIEIQKLGQYLISISKKTHELQQTTRIIVEKLDEQATKIIAHQDNFYLEMSDQVNAKVRRLEDLIIQSGNTLPHVANNNNNNNNNTAVNLYNKKGIVEKDKKPAVSGKRALDQSNNNNAANNKTHKLLRHAEAITAPAPPQPTQIINYSWIRDLEVRKRAIELTQAGVTYRVNGPPGSLLKKFIFRIFDASLLCYGIILSYQEPHFTVVYNDGDSQKLSVDQVRHSLCNEEMIPKEEVKKCFFHIEQGSHLRRDMLPTMN